MNPQKSDFELGIEKTPGICGGDARIAGTRIPVWTLVAYRNDGLSDADLLRNFPTLTTTDLEHSWGYAAANMAEIAAAILENSDDTTSPAVA